MPTVVVYILTDDPECNAVKALNKLFNSDIFLIKTVTQKLPQNQITSKYSEERKIHMEESYRVSWCLKDSLHKHKDDFLIIVKDTSVTHASAKTIDGIVRKIVESGNTSSGKFHLCYLCKWMDRCDIYSDRKEINGRSTILAKTQAPHGIQALLVSPHGRDILLGERTMKNGKAIVAGLFERENMSPVLTEFILKGYIDATCVVPNLFDFDISKAVRNSDYLKTIECLPPPINKTGEAITASGRMSSFVVLFLLIILIALGLFMLVGRS